MTEPFDDYQSARAVSDDDRLRALASLARHLGLDPSSLADAEVTADVDRPNLRYRIGITVADGRRFRAEFQMRRRYEDHEWEWHELPVED